MKKILGLIILLFPAFLFASGQVHKQNINKGWKFYYTQKNKWFPATVPGTIHTDLLKNKLIVDPYYRDNEKKLQWIDKENWDYKTSFTVTNKVLNQKNIERYYLV